VQNLACGLGSTVLIIYVSSLCKKDGTTATQYALIYSFSSLSRTVLSSISGFCAAYTNWSTFFVVTTLIGLPVFLIIKKLSVAPLSVAARE
jgi:PAT family beta-lactamase induction signal transducer AmpG